VALVVCLLLAIPSPSQQTVVDSGTAPTLELVQEIFDEPISLSELPDANGLWSVVTADGTPLAKIARTLPVAADVVGYRGPTEALIVFDQQLQIDKVRLLGSMDTDEHVQSVVADDGFFVQFRSWPWGGPAGKVDIDAVSGATLTSLALAEGVLKRIGGDRPSLVFPNELSNEEIAKWPSTDSVHDDTVQDDKVQDDKVRDDLLRTGPLTDAIAGYQGPTELVMQVDDDNVVQRIKIRESFDNEPYVDYVRTEAGFWKTFTGKSIDELASFDPESAGVEGVSGATMTSLAVADTVVAAAKEIQAAQDDLAENRGSELNWSMRFSMPDIATLTVLALMTVASWMRWFRHRLFRKAWLLTVFLVIGIWAGNLLSMALVAGWGAEGIAWRLAPGLAAVVCVAMLSPITTKGNPYCNHLCPHGAIQQLVRPTPKSRRAIKLPKRLQQKLVWLPGITLVIAYLMLILRPTLDLSSWEPFHAYLFRVASWFSIAVALGTLAISAFIPMGYCRLGCPTGRLLDYLRRSYRSNQVGLADYVAMLLLGVAMASKWS
jgi:Na+-translocating ferredoxin:NAD+ oxidoreductase RnfG subunit